MSDPLPERASLEWLRKSAKQRLRLLKSEDPEARLADAQLLVARAHGFASWRALKAEVDRRAAPGEAETASFLRAVGQGETESVRSALAERPALARAIGPHPFWGGRPQALHVAIETGRGDMFDLLLAAGAELDGRNQEYDHWSPLMLAIQRGRAGMQAELIARGARVGLAEALLLGEDSRLDRLVARGRLPAAVPNHGSWLAFARTPHAVRRLLALGADPRAADRWGVTPIEAMSRLGDAGKELVREMMLNGVPADAHQFARLGDRESLERIAAADPEATLADAVLIAAIEGGHHALARWLLDLGASPDAIAEAAPARNRALHAAAWRGDLAMARLLVEAGADIAALDEEHRTTPRLWARTAAGITGNPGCERVADYLAGLEGGDSA